VDSCQRKEARRAMTTRPSLVWLLAAMPALCPAAAPGHDLWLIPADGPVAVGKPATIRANVGMAFPESVQAPDPERFKRRRLLPPAGSEATLDAAGQDGKSGLLRFTPAQPGIYAVAVETEPKVLSLSAERFNEYLVSDGLPHIYRLRAREGTLDRPARERYSKSPKALLRVGDGGRGDPCRSMGLPLEIVPLRNPFAVKPGEALAVRVLFQGKPLPEAHLGWQHPGDGETARGTVRTSGKGEALVPIATAGPMTIRLTHMTRPKTEDYEWESFWTTLTFIVPEG
jgi:uncharacterized GH25 family protein